MDDDEDGYTDDADPTAKAEDEIGFGDTDCNDGIDNDGDGFKDSEDPECTDASITSEKTGCENDIDDDEDGYTDEDDPDCASGDEEIGFGTTVVMMVSITMQTEMSMQMTVTVTMQKMMMKQHQNVKTTKMMMVMDGSMKTIQTVMKEKTKTPPHPFIDAMMGLTTMEMALPTAMIRAVSKGQDDSEANACENDSMMMAMDGPTSMIWAVWEIRSPIQKEGSTMRHNVPTTSTMMAMASLTLLTQNVPLLLPHKKQVFVQTVRTTMGDGWYDSEDPECDSDFTEAGYDPNGPACNNGADDDGDGYVDALDGGCFNAYG